MQYLPVQKPFNKDKGRKTLRKVYCPLQSNPEPTCAFATAKDCRTIQTCGWVYKSHDSVFSIHERQFIRKP